MTSGFASYVELLTCLEMARDAKNADDNPRGSQIIDSIRLRAPGVGVGHRGSDARCEHNLASLSDAGEAKFLVGRCMHCGATAFRAGQFHRYARCEVG